MKKIFTRLIMVLIVVLIGIGFKSYKLFSYSFEKKSIRVEKETTITLKDTKQNRKAKFILRSSSIYIL